MADDRFRKERRAGLLSRHHLALPRPAGRRGQPGPLTRAGRRRKHPRASMRVIGSHSPVRTTGSDHPRRRECDVQPYRLNRSLGRIPPEAARRVNLKSANRGPAKAGLVLTMSWTTQPGSQKRRRWRFHRRLFRRAERASAAAKVYNKKCCYKEEYGLIQHNNN